MTVATAQQLAERFAAVWTEPDPGLRRKLVEELWTQDAVHLVQPPVEIRESAAFLGFADPVLESRGHDALELRVARAYERFVEPGEFTFRARQDAVRLRDVVRFTWEMTPAGGGELVGGGVEFVVLAADGRISEDYRFPGL